MNLLFFKSEKVGIYFFNHIIVFFFLSLFVPCSLVAQIPPKLAWIKKYQNNGSNIISSWAETEDGYLIGGSSNAGKSGAKSEASKGGYDYWVIKTDKTGKKQWDKTFGGRSDDKLVKVVNSPDGGFLIVGNSDSPASGDKTSENARGTSIWIVKISSSGVKVWDKTLLNYNYELAADVTPAKNGGYVVGSTIFSEAGDEWGDISGEEISMRAIKISEQGDLDWNTFITSASYIVYHGMGNDYLSKIIATKDGGYLVAGYTDDMDYGYSKEEPGFGGYDVWLIKLDSTGRRVWDKVYGGDQDDRVSDIIALESGGYVLTSISKSKQSGNKTVEGNTSEGIDYTANHIWMFGLTGSGELSWQKMIQSEDRPTDYFSEPLFSTADLVPAFSGFYLLTELLQEGTFDRKLYSFNNAGTQQYVKSINPKFYSKAAFLEISKTGDLFVGSTGVGSDVTQPNFLGYALIKYKADELISKNIEVAATPFLNYKENLTIEVKLNNFTHAKVQIFDNDILIKEWANEGLNAYLFLWKNASAGVHNISAKAIDANGNIVISNTFPSTVFENPVVLQKAFNLNGGSKAIDDLIYLSSNNSTEISCIGKRFSDQKIKITPPADTIRASMIRSSITGTSTTPATIILNNIPSAQYEVYLYVWEHDVPSTYSITVQGKVVLTNHYSGNKGMWRKVGPFKASASDGHIVIRTLGGNANISAVEVWKINSKFVSAFNLNGNGVLEVDGKKFAPIETAWWQYVIGKRFEDQSISLLPAVDGDKAKMLRSSINSTENARAEINIAYFTGLHDVYLYVWEDNNSSTYSIKINDEVVVENYKSGAKGSWAKLGPFRTLVARNVIKIEAYGGDANISGLEFWKVGNVDFTPVVSPSNSQSSQRVIGGDVVANTQHIIAFPNPFNNHVTVEFPSSQTGKTYITITDMTGNIHLKADKSLINEKSLNINTLNLKPGLYILKIKTPSYEKVFRITK